MSHNSRQPNTLHCTHCGAENYGFAAFCISCGEPFDTLPDSDLSFFDAADASIRPVKAEPKEPQEQERPASTLDGLSGRLARRETIIGLVLLALVLGYAVYSWQRSSAEASAYKEGVAAEQHKDWETAATAFDKAGDHHDAGSKATHAHFQVAERDRLFDEALVAADSQDWKTALSALEGVQAIQPAYADSENRLVQARSQVFKLELNNLVYLVSDGPQPGLYMLDETNTPYRLPGSDAQSVIHAMSADGARFVYDRAKSNDYTTSAQGDANSTNNDHALTNAFNDVTVKREPVLVTLDKGKVKTRPLPNLNGNGTGIFSQKGLWWYSGWYSSPKDSDYLQYEVAYSDGQAAESSAAAIVVTNPFSSTRVLALDPERSRLVLGQAHGTPRTVDRETRLYMANADGTGQRFVQAIEGDVQSAQISGDGRWLLAVTRYVITHVGIEQSVWLAPIGTGVADAPAGPVRKLDTLAGTSSDIPRHLSAALVPTNNSPTRVVVDRASANLEHVAFYSADSSDMTHIIYNLPATGMGYDTVGFSNSGAYLGLRRQYGPDAKLEMVSLGKDDFLNSWGVPLPAQAAQKVRVSFAPHDDYVLATVQNLNSPTGGYVHEIYAARIQKNGGMADAKLIATAATQSDTTLPAIAPTSGGSMLAYVNAHHELRVTFYDGQQDTLIAVAISAVWALGHNDDHSWAR